MTGPEFSHLVTLVEAAQGRDVALEADADARAAIARRLGLADLSRFAVRAEIRAVAGGIAARGMVEAGTESAGAHNKAEASSKPEVTVLRFMTFSVFIDGPSGFPQ